MKLTFLGTGDFYPRSLGHNSALLEWEGTRLAIDFPASNAPSLERLGLGLHDVPNVFLSHLHEDHINGIQQFAYWHEIHSRMTGTGRKPRLFIASNLLDDLWSAVRPGLSLTTGGVRELDHYFDLHIIDSGHPAFELDGVSFECIRTDHVPSMVSYGPLAKPYFYFSCDSKADPPLLASVAPEIERIFHDCHLWDLKIEAHASLEDIRALPPEIQAKTVLMHYNYLYETPESRRKFEETVQIKLASPLETFTFTS
ncbi:MBL fold metallo-hydrolase [Paenibacillus sp. P26]|nr:MBL fold metallo-hydrolase [Paenibacillus sp. P26]UUZ97336.1 MBL fold metallo-hydrolase [Paenibacillus sp. P25]